MATITAPDSIDVEQLQKHVEALAEQYRDPSKGNFPKMEPLQRPGGSVMWRGSNSLRPTGVHDVLTRSGPDFVRSAYQLILGRTASSVEVQTYVDQLCCGAIDRTDMLLALCASPEPKAEGAPTTFIGRRKILRKLSRLPVVGRLFRIIEAIILLPGTLRRIEAQQHRNSLGGPQ